MSSIPIPLNEWAQVTWTLEGNTTTLYVNGQQVGQQTWVAAPAAVLRVNNWIGKSNWEETPSHDERIRGVLDDISVYSRALCASEIVALVNMQPPIDTTPPTVVCPPETTSAADANCQAEVPDITSMVSASDNCGGNVTLSQSPAPSTLVGLGTHTIVVTATDQAGNTASCSTTLTVVDITPPVLGAITAPMDPLPTFAPIAASAAFDDNCGPQTAVWTWGDGVATVGVIDTSTMTISGEHAYAIPGVYTVTLTVTDHSGLSAQRSFEYVVVYDPNGGFVTGGGWINSPLGAYAPDPALSGKAAFGFVAKYQKGSTAPTGNTEFQFKAGNLGFKSSTYQWLAVSGARAQYKGWGSINGEGNYAFKVTAIDGQDNGGGGADRFRIKVWDEATSSVVYDNQRDTDDNAPLSDATILQGGSIVIHKK